MSSLSSMAIKELEDACTKLNIRTTNKEKKQKAKLMQKLLTFARRHKKLLGNLWRSGANAPDRARPEWCKCTRPCKGGVLHVQQTGQGISQLVTPQPVAIHLAQSG